MGLCLLVYTLGQRQLRQTLSRTKSTVKNQLGRPTNRPTLRWIFQCFQSIHLLINFQVNWTLRFFTLKMTPSPVVAWEIPERTKNS